MIAFSSVSAPFTPCVGIGTSFQRAPLCSRRRYSPSAITMALDHHTTLHMAQTAHTALTHLLSAVPSSSSSLHSLSHLLADAAATASSAVSATADAAASVASDTADVTSAAAGAAADAVKNSKPGAWGQFVHLIESCIVLLHDSFQKIGVPGPYGFSIIIFTVLVKAITFPLNYRQMESTMKMQAMAPRLKKLQTDYKDNPAVLNQMIAELYRKYNVNPLAGLLPVFAQIPVWVALYRSVLNLASENLLNESFLWLPSLQGPVSKTGQGLDTWLYPLIDGAPPIGWHDALCYLALPAILVVSQFYSQKIIAPPSPDPQQKQANVFLKFMPFLIGWFSLNVPSGLGVYWVTNNVLSTLQTVYIRSKFSAADLPTMDEEGESSASSNGSESPADGFSSATTSAPKTAKASKSKKRRKRR